MTPEEKKQESEFARLSYHTNKVYEKRKAYFKKYYQEHREERIAYQMKYKKRAEQ